MYANLNEKPEGLWEFVAVRGGSVAEDLSGFCTSKSLEDFCGLIFCEILSEILEIWDGRLQTLFDLLPPWSTLAVAILTVFDIGKAASVSAFKVGSTSRFEQCPG